MLDYHLPVLLDETVTGLDLKPNGIYVDVTFGGGGHSREILKRLDGGRLFVFDQDEDAVSNLPDDPRITFIKGNFRFFRQFLHYYKIDEVDGVLADLGVSSHHFDDEDRGFSFRFNSRLDMRMNQESTLSAYAVINEYDESQLADVFYYYGEIRNARLLASKIIKSRSEKNIVTTEELKDIALECTSAKVQNKYLSQVFQSIRIEVNNEMLALKEMLLQAGEMLKKDGRLSVITYHSLEDRLVKNFMRSGNFEGKAEKDFYGNMLSPFKPINKKVIVASAQELKINSRARSAKLRVAEKV